jgi:hypothetical protein
MEQVIKRFLNINCRRFVQITDQLVSNLAVPDVSGAFWMTEINADLIRKYAVSAPVLQAVAIVQPSPSLDCAS